MSRETKPENPLAFPKVVPDGDTNQNGMTLRDYFAAKAMESYLKGQMIPRHSIASRLKLFFGLKGWTRDFDINQDQISERSYQVADAMLKAREQ